MKETAVGILIDGIVKGDKAFIEAHVAEDYIQHNPDVADGRAGLLALIHYLHSLDTKPQITPVRVLQDGDLVVVHSEHVIGTEGIAFDLFRFENGVAVEHWDGIQPKPETTVSGRSMTDGPTEIVDLDKTAANRTLVVNFVEDILVVGKATGSPTTSARRISSTTRRSTTGSRGSAHSSSIFGRTTSRFPTRQSITSSRREIS